MNDEAYLRRKRAGEAARIAAYGSLNVRTPADYTLKESLEKLGEELQRIKPPKKSKKGDASVVDEAALGPIFESETDE